MLVCAQESEPSTSSSEKQASPEASSSTSSSAAVDGASNPSIAGSNKQLQVSKEVIETLRNKVFGKPQTYSSSTISCATSLICTEATSASVLSAGHSRLRLLLL